MHVLIITPGFPVDKFDTSCIPPMQEFLNGMRLNYPEVIFSVIALHYPYKKNFYDWNGITVYACGGRGKKQPQRILIWFLSILIALKINRKFNIDIIHSFWLTESAMVGNIVGKLLSVNHVSTIMGQDAKENNKFLQRLNLKNIIKIALSDYQARVFKQSCKVEPDKIIPWGINSFQTENINREIDVLGVGSLIPVKNFKLFISIIKGLKEEFPEIKSVIIGEGEQFEELKELVSNQKLDSNLQLAGFLNHETVLSYMNKSKILIHTSDYESFGYVIAEALVSGCYIVCKPVGCAKECDRLSIAESYDEFIIKIRKLLLNGKEFKSNNLFPLEQTIRSYADLYTSCSKGNVTLEE